MTETTHPHEIMAGFANVYEGKIKPEILYGGDFIKLDGMIQFEVDALKVVENSGIKPQIGTYAEYNVAVNTLSMIRNGAGEERINGIIEEVDERVKTMDSMLKDDLIYSKHRRLAN